MRETLEDVDALVGIGGECATGVTAAVVRAPLVARMGVKDGGGDPLDTGSRKEEGGLAMTCCWLAITVVSIGTDLVDACCRNC